MPDPAQTDAKKPKLVAPYRFYFQLSVFFGFSELAEKKWAL